MKAARLHGPRDVRIETIPVPQPQAGEILVRVRAVTVCPSDWRMYIDGHAGGVVPPGPIIQGHEFAGDVVKAHPSANLPAVGTRVAVEPSWACGRCDMCLTGRGNICRHVRFPSFPPVDGALAEFITCPAEAACPLPDTMTYEEGALTEPLGVALHAVRLAGIRASDEVCILGAGVIGISVQLLCLRIGCGAITLIEPVAERRPLPTQLGASRVAASAEEILIPSRANGAGQRFEADVVMECSGDNAALDQAVRLARPGGKVVVVGIPRDERITFDMSIARRHELTVLFSRRSHNTLPEAVRLLSSREIDFRPLPLQHFSLDQTAQALELTGRPGAVLRAVVHP